jgi:release factor glutamine methyltransferase
MTVLEVIQRSSEFLSRKGVDSPRLQTELLLAHVLHLPRMQLYLNFERALTESELGNLRELVRRRGQREPLQQITGSTSFCGLEIAVNRDVLVPRPETELLAEQACQFLAQRVAETPPSILDFGTGSGCLAVFLASKCSGALVSAVELSPKALELARDNAARHGLSERIRFLQGDGFAVLPPTSRFDLIVSNPPYIPSNEISVLQPEVRDYEPRLALDGGADGLDFYRRLAKESAQFLGPGGKLMLEFGDGQAARLRDLFEQHNWVVEAVLDDYTRRPRILIAMR